jgi:hypothetical protein
VVEARESAQRGRARAQGSDVLCVERQRQLTRNRYAYDDEKREALTKWEQRLRKIISSTSAPSPEVSHKIDKP